MSEQDHPTGSVPQKVVPVWVAVAFIALSLFFTLVGALMGYLSYTSPLAQAQRSGLLEELIATTPDGGSLSLAVDYTDPGMVGAMMMYPITMLGVIGLFAGLALLLVAFGHRRRVLLYGVEDSEPAPPKPAWTDSPKAQASAARAVVIWLIALGMLGVILSAIGIAEWWPRHLSATEMPIGEWVDLYPRSMPADMGPDGRFVFRIESPDSPSGLPWYWYAMSTESTRYLVNGEPIDAEQLEQSLKEMPSVSVDVIVREPGRLWQIDLYMVPPPSE